MKVDQLVACVEALRGELGAGVVVVGADVPERYHLDASRLAPNAPAALVRPRTTEEVATTLRICQAHGVPVVPQGGMTGLAGGARPDSSAIALSLDRMTGVESVDAATATLSALAGTPLELVQRAADEAGFLCALDLGARGSCTIGGNLATNAGGNRVIRYGMVREMVLGLEAVLADGTVIHSLNRMQKNNTGYDLKQLFIGSEGTLGVITRVVLRLFPKPVSTCNAFVGLSSYEAVVRLLRAAQAGLGGTLSSFEVMWPGFHDTMIARVHGLRQPLAAPHALYTLIEAAGADPAPDAARFEAFLARMLEQGVIEDAVIAQSAADSKAMWAIRESVAEFRRVFPDGTVGFDVSVPIGDMSRAVERMQGELRKRWPDIVMLPYGHIGDSNLHFVTSVPGMRPQPKSEVDATVYGIVREFGGAISAEHGIGLTRREYLGHSRTPAEIALMRTLKAALDPLGILNPGKVL